jgi:hypothetical protein
MDITAVLQTIQGMSANVAGKTAIFYDYGDSALNSLSADDRMTEVSGETCHISENVSENAGSQLSALSP